MKKIIFKSKLLMGFFNRQLNGNFVSLLAEEEVKKMFLLAMREEKIKD